LKFGMTLDWQQLFETFDRKRILLIGDSILDVYTYGTALGLSAETPTIVARKGKVRHSVGGAALVCRNLLELGAAVSFITLVGDDEEAAHVTGLAGPKLELLPVSERGRQTTVKHRFWVDSYKLFQLDTRDEAPIGQAAVDQVMTHVARRLPEIDAAIISDYRHGLLTADLVGRLMETLRQARKAVFIDSQVAQNVSNHRLYRGGGVFCLNLKEARCIDAAFEAQPRVEAFAGLRRTLETGRIVVKLGDGGAMMLDDDQIVQSPAIRVEAVDTTGAGDAFLAAFCLCGGAAPEIALNVANAWAGLSIGIHGTAPPSRGDLPKVLNLA
jgi:rfaE bifunctional protein kinase chain/domain